MVCWTGIVGAPREPSKERTECAHKVIAPCAVMHIPLPPYPASRACPFSHPPPQLPNDQLRIKGKQPSRKAIGTISKRFLFYFSPYDGLTTSAGNIVPCCGAIF
ncbi:unnamed protein product, partial [Iphiclides podalirius]